MMNDYILFNKQRFAAILFLLIAGVLFAAATNAQSIAARQTTLLQTGAPELFDFAELQMLFAKETVPPALSGKLNRLLTVPFVDNSQTAPARLSASPQLGEFLRVACWNIERGIEFDAIAAAFGDEAEFAAMLDPQRFPLNSKERREVLEQATALRAADVIVLNEVDWGMRRTDYRHVAQDLARRLGMNYAFGVQFVELSPVGYSLEPAHADQEENEILEQIRVDPARYKGLHGVAVLSRFKLENVRLVPFKEQPYDWYKGEKTGASPLENGKRMLSKAVFLEQTTREVRRGGRSALLADIADTRFPGGRVTIAATHLENRAKPAGRVKQLEELLGTIREIRHPVVVAGDMNTSTSDLTPTSLRRVLTQRYGNPKFWAQKAVSYWLGFGLVEESLMFAVTFGRKQNDPTVCDIQFFSPNPGRRFFATLKNFRFNDGSAFDFRGDPRRSTGNRGKTLSASNERARKGFVTTYEVTRPIAFVGKNKLDWFFVKPARLTDPTDRRQSYVFAPHFGRTLARLNEAIEERISDHRPLIVDLPLVEPPLGANKR